MQLHCMMLRGLKLMARDFARETAEFQIRISILNRFLILNFLRHSARRLTSARERGTSAFRRTVRRRR